MRCLPQLTRIWIRSGSTPETWGVDQAERYVLNIRNACSALASGRSKGRSAKEIRPSYRKFAVGSHLLFYKTASDGTIEVIRILHQSMDVPAHFGS